MNCFGWLLIVSSQVVSLGGRPFDCRAFEKVRPNLELHQSSRVSGTISDKAGAKLKNSRVELRRYLSNVRQQSIKVVYTDNDGLFQLGDLGPGKYRLLASPTRAFQQPKHLECTSKECSLSIVLDVNATDQPDSVCPIR